MLFSRLLLIFAMFGEFLQLQVHLEDRLLLKINRVEEEGRKMRLIEKIKRQVRSQDVFYAFEYFPPSSERGHRNLKIRIDRMADMQPICVSLSCSQGNLEETLAVSKHVLRYCNVDVMMHLTCVGMTKDRLLGLLDAAKAAGIRNVMAVHGVPTDEVLGRSGDIKYAVDMVRIIRNHFGNYFTIAVAGYPEGTKHLREGETREENYRRNIKYLLEKVEAGADFCVSDVFYDSELFIRFVRDCRAAGIARTFPILPGILPIHSYDSFQTLTSHLGVSVPLKVQRKLEEIKEDHRAVLGYGIELAEKMCIELLNSGYAYGLYFYTLNLEHSVRQLLEEKLKITPKSSLPWRPSANPKRLEEAVRPIFWANRPKSYLMRTEEWDEFPTGRWANIAQNSFAAFKDAHIFSRETFFERNDIKRKAWGEAPLSHEEIFEVFAGFVEGKVPFLPWCEEPLHIETSLIQKKLLAMNRAGFLTINSQPRINAVPSNDPKFGWGSDGGFVYQKAYIEFFTSPQKLRRLIDLLQTPEFALKRQFEYHAVDHKGNTYSNSKRQKPCAVTWGVFPGKEVIQPTVVDPAAFLVWKDEAFALWVRGWGSIYDPDGPSCDLIHDIHDQYFLVNIVDNNFVDGDIFEIFDKMMEN